MFGHRFFGARFYGPRYFGDGGNLPPIVVVPGEAGGRIVGGHFSRGKWRELRRKKWEELEAAIRAEEKARTKEKLQQAADIAAEAIAAAEAEGERAEINAKLVQMTVALEAAISAKRTTHMLKKADLAVQYARQLLDDEDEDDIEMMLLTQ